MRRTRIVATLGPSTDDPAVLDAIIEAGVDVVRLNAAHAGPGELATRLAAAREAAERAGREIGVLLDLPGPKVRVGDVEPGTVLEDGAEFVLHTDTCTGDSARACVTHRGLPDDVSRGDRLLLDDGRIELRVTATSPGEVRTTVEHGGPLVSHKGVNVPQRSLSVEAITRYDRTVLAWAMANDVDWIGQSFVRSRRDVESLREFMTTRLIPIVAKIEKHEAVGDLRGIIEVADAVMVARGDLAVETAPERVPVLQRRIIAAAREIGRPVVIATEMLDSMRERTRPTRAEASDVANAIFARADAVMLSGETSIGDHPVDAVATMARIAEAAEEALDPPRTLHVTGGDDVQQAVSAAVCELATDLDLAAIVTLTQSGATSMMVSRFRPITPIVAVTPRVRTARRLALAWGVQALVVPFEGDTAHVLDAATAGLRDAGFAQPGQRIALTSGMASRTPGGTDFVHVRAV